MSASRLVTIMCDAPSCGRWWDGGVADTATRARAQLAGTGWRLNVLSATDRVRLDFCPEHAGTPIEN